MHVYIDMSVYTRVLTFADDVCIYSHSMIDRAELGLQVIIYVA